MKAQMVDYKRSRRHPKKTMKASQRRQVPTAEEEREALILSGEAREAGVADLLSFYARIEGVYAAASKALEENPVGSTTNTTNPPRAR